MIQRAKAGLPTVTRHDSTREGGLTLVSKLVNSKRSILGADEPPYERRSMQDDFDDNGMGLPDDEIGGGPDTGDMDTAGDADLDLGEGSEAGGRVSGGARRGAAAAPRKAPAPKASGGKSSGGARKAAARKGAAKRGTVKRAAKAKKGAAKKKGASARKGARKGAAKRGGKRKAGRKR